MKKLLLIALMIVFYSKGIAYSVVFTVPGYGVTKTTELITGKATKNYTQKSRKQTQFALDRNSMNESAQPFIIKTSPQNVTVLDKNNKIIHNYRVVKSWIDQAGPERVYDLVDENKTECSLTDYVDINKHHYLSFRYKKVLETYKN